MLLYLVYILFLITVALAASAVILATKLQKRYDHELFSHLLYYQVFLYTFGFYGIWGQVVIRSVLSEYFSPEQFARVCDIALLLGLPFVIFAWMMLLQFSSVLSGSRKNNWFVLGFLLINITFIILLGYLSGQAGMVKPLYLIKHYFIIANFIYTSAAAGQLFYSGKESFMITARGKRNIALGLFLVMIVQTAFLIIFSTQIYLAILFILSFFAGNSFLPIYLTYGIRIKTSASGELQGLSFEEFCQKFEVSPRESDIVREIYKGLSNKEISEKLFISLQTVKDHTHRIYIKTNVKSRAQLMNLVREISDKQ
ncbi:MAG TPA: LuxR C-terminal-related transcriptional regulator [Bacteroidales bacterium]|nr:LuxR C-terminal-related transcriptional regulator [Bacteroidales bacterium]